MKTHVHSVLLLLGLGVASCKSDKDTPKPTSLVGYWLLTRLECYCPANTPTPDEAIAFDADGKVTTYKDGQVQQTGTYTLTKGSTTCTTDTTLISFSWPSYTPTASYSLHDGVLIIDQGLCFDAPRKTYQAASAASNKK
ncbi:hypothetical protein [Hymenobacter sp. GOD-10R]|uniref:hypothetical protein n=1 Tax=Hymenobacter sp. GOD-10R TaxID=3093922 RepID=UPI002D780734|nr:hypothetical protein [Hymenobacter sp. GOD-10R]WRQ30552.1 hypothetical protein SD425_09795 [Hymenobacter sp. GOD-10R]